jgi:uncharacterized membrane protein (DUF2068 family)
MDWNLRACGRHGHATYAPTEPALRERLHVQTPVGPAWRCLRCGDFVPGTPAGEGPADNAPLIRRGRELRDAVILRLLAAERAIRGLLVLLAAYGVYRFRASHDAVARAFNEDLPLIRPLADKLHYNLDQSSIVHTIRTFIEAQSRTLAVLAIGLVAYGLLQFIEGVGLWLLRRWGEYLSVVATSIGLPIEIYELTEKLTWFRVAAFVINVAAVLYLLLTKRLFGLRGGKAAYEAQRHEESLLEVRSASDEADRGTDRGARVVEVGTPSQAGTEPATSDRPS